MSVKEVLSNSHINLEDYLEMCEEVGLDPLLVAAFIQVESGGDSYAMRYEENYAWVYKTKEIAKALNISQATEITLQKFSYGLLQLMGANFRELGFTGPLPVCLDPLLGLEFGLKYLAKTLSRWVSLQDGISAYNQGTPRRDPKDVSIYTNQYYVDKVLGLYAEMYI